MSAAASLAEIFQGFQSEIERLDSVGSTVDAAIGRLDERIAKIQSTDSSVVRKELQRILADEQAPEHKVLKRLVVSGEPQHKNTPLLLAALQARVPVWLFGDAGSGKTTSAARAAEMLDLPFRFISVCPTTTKSELMGYRDANGTYHSTAFREVYENGGVFLIDEIDNGNPSTLAVLNSALANDHCAFPDGNIKRHEHALFVAAANTIGRGADVRYVGRNGLDATTLDRFVFIPMDIDENLENALTGEKWDESMLTDIKKGGSITVKKWRRFVQSARRACQELGIDHFVTPRATLYGHSLIQVGIGLDHLKEMCVYKGLRQTDKDKIASLVSSSSGDEGTSEESEETFNQDAKRFFDEELEKLKS